MLQRNFLRSNLHLSKHPCPPFNNANIWIRETIVRYSPVTSTAESKYVQSIQQNDVYIALNVISLNVELMSHKFIHVNDSLRSIRISLQSNKLTSKMLLIFTNLFHNHKLHEGMLRYKQGEQPCCISRWKQNI